MLLSPPSRFLREKSAHLLPTKECGVHELAERSVGAGTLSRRRQQNAMQKLILKKSGTATTGKAYRIPYADVLNASQLEAVMHTEGPALVLAGAGTGKTRTLTYRVARLIEDGVGPNSILLLTFTRKAAREMMRRAAVLLDARVEKVSGGTFHSVAYTVLKSFGVPHTEHKSNSAPVRLLDQSDAEDVMSLVRSRFDVAKLKRRFPQKSTLHDIYSKAVNTSTAYEDIIVRHYPQFIDETEKIGSIIRGYNDYKHANALFDYDDLLLYLLAMTKDPRVGAVLRDRYRFLMVDEYQDTNRLQHAIIQGLAGTPANVMVVGDDAQSIYSFRGADVRNIHDVPTEFDGCRIIALEHNYRSTQPILDVCNDVIRDAPGLYAKELFTTRESGDAPYLISASNEQQQSAFIVQHILELRENHVPLSEIAVLVRSGFLSFDLEIELGKANIPYRKFGGLRFTEASHVKDVLALLRLTENPRDGIALYRILVLLEGVGQVSARRIVEAVTAHPNPLEGTDSAWGATGKGASSVRSVWSLLLSLQTVAESERCLRVAEWYRPVLERTHEDHAKRWKDVETITGIARRYATVSAFLDDVTLDPPTTALEDIEADDQEDEFLTISTIHSAKGLEWNTVFLPWLNEGRLPSTKSAEIPEQLEEERRLLYVACSRAKERLYMMYTATMMEWGDSDVLGKPSRFLDGISEERIPRFYLTEGA